MKELEEERLKREKERDTPSEHPKLPATNPNWNKKKRHHERQRGEHKQKTPTHKTESNGEKEALLPKARRHQIAPKEDIKLNTGYQPRAVGAFGEVDATHGRKSDTGISATSGEPFLPPPYATDPVVPFSLLSRESVVRRRQPSSGNIQHVGKAPVKIAESGGSVRNRRESTTTGKAQMLPVPYTERASMPTNDDRFTDITSPVSPALKSATLTQKMSSTSHSHIPLHSSPESASAPRLGGPPDPSAPPAPSVQNNKWKSAAAKGRTQQRAVVAFGESSTRIPRTSEVPKVAPS